MMKITAPEDIGSFIIVPAIAELSIRYPDLNFELDYTHKVLDLIKNGFDLAIRLGQITDSALKLKRVGNLVLIAVASPQYLLGKEQINHPTDLKVHTCLSVKAQRLSKEWVLRSHKETIHVVVKSKISCNDMPALLQIAIAGAGIALVTKFLCEPYLNSGQLIRILPDWVTPGIPVSIISPFAPSSSAKLEVTVDHIHAAINKALTI